VTVSVDQATGGIGELMPDVLEGRIEPDASSTGSRTSEGVPDGYRAMKQREAIKVNGEALMSGWTSDELDMIGTAEEVNLASVRRDGTLRRPVTISVVREGDDVNVRSVHGRNSSGSAAPRRPARRTSALAPWRRTSV
jgi:hypothetical protein